MTFINIKLFQCEQTYLTIMSYNINKYILSYVVITPKMLTNSYSETLKVKKEMKWLLQEIEKLNVEEFSY